MIRRRFLRALRGVGAAAWTLASAHPAAGVSNVRPEAKWAWAENAGYVDWRDAGGSGEGVVAAATYLHGYAWGENIGWICLGRNAPADGVRYGNLDGADFGVNIDPATGFLFGYAWAENAGWIRFGAPTPRAERPRIRPDGPGGEWRLTGCAWGENVGWIRLDDLKGWRPTLINIFRRRDGRITLEWIGNGPGGYAVVESSPGVDPPLWREVSPVLAGSSWTFAPDPDAALGLFRIRLE